jgi:SAM-dependent methyltransferase
LRSFDRAADFYDATRDLDAAGRQRLTDILVAEVAGRRCLEVGIGTGLVGLALARRGIPMWGVDLSERMLAKLVDKFTHPGEVRVVRADATALPLASGAFEVVLTSQMLHLVDDWRAALRELARVVRPDGVVLIDLGNDPDSGWGGPWAEAARKFWEFACPEGRREPAVWADNALRAEMQRLGFAARPLTAVESFGEFSVDDVISRLERGLWSACWALGPDRIAGAARRTRAWAVATFPDVSARHRVRRTISYWAYDRRP